MDQGILSYFKLLILPPGLNLFLVAIGYICLWRWRCLGRTLVAIGLISLYLLTTPVIADWLMSSLQSYPPVVVAKDKKLKDQGAQAIVILTANSAYAPEYGGSGFSGASLQRALFAAVLYNKTLLPILISGGEARGELMPEATQMGQLMEQIYNVPVWKVEARSQDTYQNAVYSEKILTQASIKRFYLVTSAWHMRRALWAFKRVGLDPIPAPTDYAQLDVPSNIIGAWLPTLKAFNMSSLALHEYVGYLWYQFYY